MWPKSVFPSDMMSSESAVNSSESAVNCSAVGLRIQPVHVCVCACVHACVYAWLVLVVCQYAVLVGEVVDGSGLSQLPRVYFN